MSNVYLRVLFGATCASGFMSENNEQSGKNIVVSTPFDNMELCWSPNTFDTALGAGAGNDQEKLVRIRPRDSVCFFSGNTLGNAKPPHQGLSNAALHGPRLEGRAGVRSLWNGALWSLGAFYCKHWTQSVKHTRPLFRFSDRLYDHFESTQFHYLRPVSA